MDSLTSGGRSYAVDRATRADLPAIVALLSDDVLGRSRETADPRPYEAAFEAIDSDPRHFLVVVRAPEGRLAATMHLMLLPSLTRGAQRGWRSKASASPLPSGARVWAPP